MEDILNYIEERANRIERQGMRNGQLLTGEETEQRKYTARQLRILGEDLRNGFHVRESS